MYLSDSRRLRLSDEVLHRPVETNSHGHDEVFEFVAKVVFKILLYFSAVTLPSMNIGPIMEVDDRAHHTVTRSGCSGLATAI